jgi:hypothetical protein
MEKLMMRFVLTALMTGIACSVVGEASADEMDTEDVGVAEEELNTATLRSGVYIKSIQASGSGCRTEDSVRSILSDDKLSFVVVFDDMGLAYPSGSQLQAKSCVVVLNLHVPQGIQISLGTVNTRGIVSLDPGHRARFISRYFLAGVPLGLTYTSLLRGPHEDFEYESTDNILLGSANWSPCGSSVLLGLNTTIFLDASRNWRGNSLLNVDDVDGKWRKVLNIQWRKCQ